MTKLHQSSLDRRTLLGGAAAAAAAVTLGSSRISAAPAVRGEQLINAGFQDGENVILIGTLGEAETINPFLVNDTEAYWRVKMLFEQFMRTDPATHVPTAGPGLVAEYTLEELTYTFKIHDNAKFNDGTDVTADDAAFTLTALLNPATNSPNSGYFTSIAGAEEFIAGTATEVSGISVVDPKTLSVTLATPDASFLFNLRYVHVVPKALLEGKNLTDDPFFDNPIGAGPFKFESWSVGGDFVASRNEHYYQEGRPYLDGFIHRIIADSNTLALALQSGEIDGSQYPAPALRDTIAQNSDMEFIVPPFSYPDGLFFNLEHEWLAKKEVRQAICHAINVEQFVADSLMGLGAVATGPIAPESWAFASDLVPPAYDPDKSRELLASVEFPEGTEIRCSVNIGNVMREDWLIFSQQALQDVGISIVAEPLEFATLVEAVTSTGDFEIVGVPFGGANADPSELVPQFTTGDPGNFSHYSNPEVDQLMDAARQELDIEAAKELWKQVQQILIDDAPMMFAWSRPFLNAVNRRFTGYTPSNGEQGIFFSLEEVQVTG